MNSNDTSTIAALNVLGLKQIKSPKKGLHFISKSGRHYSVLTETGDIFGYTGKKSYKIGNGGLDMFFQKVFSKPKSYGVL